MRRTTATFSCDIAAKYRVGGQRIVVVSSLDFAVKLLPWRGFATG
jgi:hypothetical protein